MEKTYIFEGKTTNEAIEKGLKELKVTKSKVEIKVLESEDKRSFFSILTPRVVKVEMKLKEDVQLANKETSKEDVEKKEYKKVELDSQEIETIKKNADSFMKEFINTLPVKGITYEIKEEEENILIDINGEDTGCLIGYRGDTLNSLQNIISNIANKDVKGKGRVIIDISGYRAKRKKELENLAEKISHTVTKTRKPITLEPMTAYERKIIHSKLQENSRVKTYSVGEEPYRKVVVSLK